MHRERLSFTFCRDNHEKLLLKSNLQIQVCSAGTLDWGSNQRDKEMIEVAKEMGYTLSGVTQAISYDMLKQMNLIIVFESVQKDLVTKYVEYGHWDRIVLFNDIAFNKSRISKTLISNPMTSTKSGKDNRRRLQNID